MCGIVGYIGKKDAFPILIKGLRRLEYRGYDSAGVALINNDGKLNVCKTKHLTNTRASGADEALKLTPPRVFSLEQCLEFIDTDELLEVTPKSLRMRKKILDSRLRKRASINK